jgi:hypothetical protein
VCRLRVATLVKRHLTTGAKSVTHWGHFRREASVSESNTTGAVAPSVGVNRRLVRCRVAEQVRSAAMPEGLLRHGSGRGVSEARSSCNA